MKTSLGRKLLIYSAGIFILLLLATFTLLERNQAQAWEDYLLNQSLSFARLATPELLKRFRGSFPPDEPADISEMHEFLGLNRDLVQFSLISPTGRRLYQSGIFENFSHLDIKTFNEDEILLRLDAKRTTMVTHRLDDGSRILDLLEPAFGPTGQQVVSVRYLISYDSVDTRLRQARNHFVWVAIAAVLSCLALFSIFARKMTKPIEVLTDGARSLAKGELQTRIQVQNKDELGTLAQAFNDMASNLSANRQELTLKNQELSTANENLQSMQEQLLRSERLAAIGQLAAGVSHEIDNPVGIILGHAELLLEDLDENDPMCEDLNAIIEECRRCKRITGGLLGFARASQSNYEAVDIIQLIQEAMASLRPQKLFKDLELKVNTETRKLLVTVDADQLRQVLINVFLNAAQAMHGQGKLHISLLREHDLIVVHVDDSGPGIPESALEKIFQPFYSTKAKGEGTGLGLPLCRKLIEAQQGQIFAQNSALGGARITITLPLSKQLKKL